MKRQQRASEWLQRAKSHMARAKAGKISSEILYEVAQTPLIVNRLRTKPITEVLRFIHVDFFVDPGGGWKRPIPDP